jgi:hypothetical protein
MQHRYASKAGASIPTSDEGPTVAAVAGPRGLAQDVSHHFADIVEGCKGIRSATLAAVAQFGFDPCTQAQVAAHEAGHVVVARSLGATVESARLVRRIEFGRTIWVGSNTYTPAGGFTAATARVDTTFVLRAATHHLAGFIGEQIAGLSHPSSSIDERVKALTFCRVVATVAGVPAEEVASHIGDYCESIILRNRRAFDIVRAHLYRARRLTRVEAARMLARVC